MKRSLMSVRHHHTFLPPALQSRLYGSEEGTVEGQQGK